MGVLIAIAVVVAATLLINKLGDWFDNKTGWILGAIVATAVGSLLLASLVHAYRDSVQPRPAPVCKQVGTC
jgi:Na+/melibiose symporter-like transporter